MDVTPVPPTEVIQMFCFKNHLQLIAFKRKIPFNWSVYRILSWFPVPYLFAVLNNLTDLGFQAALTMVDARTLNETDYLLVTDVNGSTSLVRFELKELYFDSQLGRRPSFTFVFFNMRYVYNPTLQTFTEVTHDFDRTPVGHLLKQFEFGREESEIDLLLETYEPNLITIVPPKVAEVIVAEVFSMMGILEVIFMYFVWYDGAKAYLFFLTALAIYSKVVAVQDKFDNHKAISDYLSAEKPIIVLRKSEEGGTSKISVDSETLVPGDIVEVTTNLEIPADMILVSGSCVVDDQNITGHSLDSIKFAVDLNAIDPATTPEHLPEVCILKNGSRCVQTRTTINSTVLAIVWRTGFHSEKGVVLRNLLLPKKEKFKFFDEAMRWIWLSIYFWVVSSVIYLVIQTFFMTKITISFKDGLVKAGELFFATVKPVIPFCLFMALEKSKSRLEKKDILTFNKFKINTCGSIKTAFLDKTGTLTEDSNEIKAMHVAVGFDRSLAKSTVVPPTAVNLSARTIQRLQESKASNINDKSFENDFFQHTIEESHVVPVFKTSVADNGVYFSKDTDDFRVVRELGQAGREFQLCAAFCNSVVRLGRKMIGEEIDISFIEHSPYEMRYESSFGSHEWVKRYVLRDDVLGKSAWSRSYEVVKLFEFTNELKRMGVVLRSAEGHLIFVCKGASEEIEQICQEESLPAEFQAKVFEICSQGSRLFALGFRRLPANANLDNRSQLESNLTFCGFYSVTDPIKEASPAIISELTQNLVQCVMITGDNIFSAVHVAHKCGFIPQGRNLFFGEKLVRNGQEQVYWIRFDPENDQENVINKMKARTKVTGMDGGRVIKNIEELYHQRDRLLLGLSAATYRFLIDWIHEHRRDTAPNLLEFVHTHCVVYGRVNCQEKAFIVKNHKKFAGKKHPNLFIGDGDNDSEALKVADVSLVLRRSQLSFSSAFSAVHGDLRAILDLIREGKCSLENGIQSFKFFILLTVCQYVATFLLYLGYISFNSWENVWVDAFVVMFFTGYISSFRPREQSTPHVPRVSISDPKLLFTLVSHCLFASVVIILSHFYFTDLPFYKPNYDQVTPADKVNFSPVMDDYYFYDNHFLFCIINIILLIFFVFTNYSGKFREKFTSNWGAVVYALLFALFFFYLCRIGEMSQPDWLSQILADNFRIQKTFGTGWVYLLSAAFYCFCALVIEKLTDLLFFVYFRNKEMRERAQFVQGIN